jgi:hypothetical protein
MRSGPEERLPTSGKQTGIRGYGHTRPLLGKDSLPGGPEGCPHPLTASQKVNCTAKDDASQKAPE